MAQTVRIIEIAELLGVSKQRAHQLAGEEGFRLWDRREVTAWAKGWRREKPWR